MAKISAGRGPVRALARSRGSTWVEVGGGAVVGRSRAGRTSSRIGAGSGRRAALARAASISPAARSSGATRAARRGDVSAGVSSHSIPGRSPPGTSSVATAPGGRSVSSIGASSSHPPELRTGYGRGGEAPTGGTGSGSGLLGSTKTPSPQEGHRNAWYPSVRSPRTRWPEAHARLNVWTCGPSVPSSCRNRLARPRKLKTTPHAIRTQSIEPRAQRGDRCRNYQKGRRPGQLARGQGTPLNRDPRPNASCDRPDVIRSYGASDE